MTAAIVKPKNGRAKLVAPPIQASLPAKLPPVLDDGIHLRDAYDYDLIGAVRYSHLKLIEQSPKHYRHAECGGSKPATKTMKRGSLVHCAVYEPDRLPLEYVVYLGERRGNAWADFKAQHADREIVTQAEYEVALRIRDAVRDDPLAGPIVARAGKREPTLLWHDPETGLRCKGRPDHICVDHVIPDLKTARSAAPRLYGNQAANLSYHVQNVFYADGYERLTGHAASSLQIVVENFEPYDVVCYFLDEKTIAAARDDYRRWLATVRDCRRDGAWPGQSRGQVLRLELPKWARPRPDNDDLSDLGLE